MGSRRVELPLGRYMHVLAFGHKIYDVTIET